MSSQLMISIFSAQLIDNHALTRARLSRHMPAGSTFGSLELTAIFVREPPRAIALISTVPVSGPRQPRTQRAFTRSGWLLDTVIRGSRCVSFTSMTYSLIRSVGLNTSPFTCSLSFKIVSRSCLKLMRCCILHGAVRCSYDIFLSAVPLLLGALRSASLKLL